MAEGAGEVKDEEIAALWQEQPAPPKDAGATPFARFCIRVSVLVAKRIAKVESADFSIFLMSENVAGDKDLSPTDSMPLLENGNDSISGSMWLVSPTLKDAYRLKLPCAEQTKFKADIVDASFGSHPAILLDRRGAHPIAHAYPKGMANPEQSHVLVIEERPITENEVKEALDRFYESSLRTPLLNSEGHAVKVWKHAAKGIPAHRPEERIQGRAVDHLRARFPRAYLRAEPVTDDGRADITLSFPVLSTGGHSSLRFDWVLELKALCDRTEKGAKIAKTKCVEAVRSGLEQVVAYRNCFSAGRSALCCYDMRAANDGEDKCFAQIKGDAKEANTPLWHWYLYRSTKLSRGAKQLIPA